MEGIGRRITCWPLTRTLVENGVCKGRGGCLLTGSREGGGVCEIRIQTDNLSSLSTSSTIHKH